MSSETWRTRSTLISKGMSWGGYLHLTGHSLVFTPGPMDATLGVKRREWDYADITSLRAVPWYKNPFVNTIISLRSGLRVRFGVKHARELRLRLSEQLHPDP
jgi:hypothetical protein